METSAKIIADSVSPDGVRLTTMEVTLHRFVLAELNTHRVFSRNSASSRAIPVEKMLDRIGMDNAARPVSWPAEKPGMQGGDELEGDDLRFAENFWESARTMAWWTVTNYLEKIAKEDRPVRLHKSVINRVMEPFQWHTVIITSTEWENFFALRCHPLAQPEIRLAADMMFDAYQASVPVVLEYGEWHTPFVDYEGQDDLESALKTSVARCAWVSTVGHDQERSAEAVENMYQRLSTADPMHASPFEHQATPGEGGLGNLVGWQQLRHMIEAGGEPWLDPVFTGQVSIEGHVELDVDWDQPSFRDQLLDGIEPLRADREGDTQPLPVSSDAPIAHQMVAADLADRLALGIKRYGQPLQAHNGRDSLQDAYEEALDLVVYLKNAIYERDHPQ